MQPGRPATSVTGIMTAPSCPDHGTTESEADRPEVEILGRETVWQGFFRIERLRLRHRRPDGGWSEPYHREVFERGHAVAMLPYDPERDRVVLIEQVRAPALLAGSPVRQIEIPAGIVEPGETPEAVAERELREETGLAARALRRILRILPSPGGSSESITLFLARVDAAGAGGHFGLASEQEDILVRALPAQEAFRLVEAGAIENAAALLALQWLQLHRDDPALFQALPPAPQGR